MTRRVRFLSLMALSALAVPAATVLMSGCGGTESISQSTYSGSYGGLWFAEQPTTIPGKEYIDTGSLSFTVDSHGKITGSFVDVYGSSSFLNGKVQNDGTFSGTISRHTTPENAGITATSYSFNGTMAHQQVDQSGILNELASITNTVHPPPAPSAGATPTPTPGPNFKAGVAGDFRESIDGVDYAGQIQAIGGTAATGG